MKAAAPVPARDALDLRRRPLDPQRGPELQPEIVCGAAHLDPLTPGSESSEQAARPRSPSPGASTSRQGREFAIKRWAVAAAAKHSSLPGRRAGPSSEHGKSPKGIRGRGVTHESQGAARVPREGFPPGARRSRTRNDRNLALTLSSMSASHNYTDVYRDSGIILLKSK